MTITLKISDNTKEKMIEYFQDKKRPKTPAYAVFQADEEDTVVTLYESGKVVFQGISADIDAAMWRQMEKHLNPTHKIEMTNSEDKTKKKEEIKKDPKYYYATTLGSDEVGTGDYFGPIVVTASYVTKEDIPFLESLGVRDSKKLTDDKIIRIVPQIIQKIPYVTLILSNKEYNEKYSKDINMNKMKAILHNKVLMELKEKVSNYDYIVVDQFAKPFVYYNYLKDTNALKGITFLTKAEDQVLSVACASLISRYVFLKEMNELSKSVGKALPKGASTKVDDIGYEIVQKYGFEKLKEIAKLSFKNTEKIKEYKKQE